MSEIYDTLLPEFCPPLDSALVAAISHDPSQTLQSAREVLQALASDLREEPLDSTERSDKETSLDDGSKRRQNGSVQADTKPTRQGKRGFSGKLSSTAVDATKGTLSNTQRVTRNKNQSHRQSENDSVDEADEAQVDELVREWEVQEARSKKKAKSRMNGTSKGLIVLPSTEDPQLDEEDLLHLTDDESSEQTGDRSEVSGDSLDVGNFQLPEAGEGDSLSFLQHAFPSRSSLYLTEILFQDCDGDVGMAVDTLMAIDLAEQEEAGAFSGSNTISSSSSSSSLKKGGGLQEDILEHGQEGAALKGRKKKAARRRIQEEQRRAKAGLPGISAASDVHESTIQEKKGKQAQIKINLTDVRHGGPIKDPKLKKLRSPDTTSTQSTTSSAPPSALFEETDEEFAKRIASEEKEKNRNPDDDRPVKDNDWLLASSVLAQLSDLLDIPSTKISAVYNSTGFNLHLTFNRLIYSQADTNAPYGIDSLDESAQAPPGTAATIVEGIAALSAIPLKQAERLFCASKGRQDATLDLISMQKLLSDVAKDEPSKKGNVPDALDPLGNLKIEDETSPIAQGSITGAKAHANGKPAAVDKTLFPTLEDSSVINTPSKQANAPWQGTSGYAGIASSFPSPAKQRAAAQSARLGAASTVLPASAARVGGQQDGDEQEWSTVISKARGRDSQHAVYRTDDCRVIADDYRQRRASALRQAAAAWRSSGGGNANGRVAQGGAAWYYADEARRLDAKARAWEMRAAQALVEQRRQARVGMLRASHAMSAGASSDESTIRGGDEIDLHGLTVHEALTVTRDCVNVWYSQPAGRTALPPLKIITGVGRHSRNQVALIKPAIVKMLDREGWRHDVDNHRGVITVRGVK